MKHLIIAAALVLLLATTIQASAADTQMVFTPGYLTNKLYVIDPGSNAVLNTYTVGTSPEHLVPNPSGSYVYVVNTDTISVLSTADYSTEATITVSGATRLGKAVISDDGKTIYVADESGTKVYFIDTVSKTVTRSVTVGNISVGYYAAGICLEGTNLYVSVWNPPGNGGKASIAIIDLNTNSEASRITLPDYSYPNDVEYSGGFLYVAERNTSFVGVYNAATGALAASVNAGTGTMDIEVRPGGFNEVWATQYCTAGSAGNASLYVINDDTNTVASTITLWAAANNIFHVGFTSGGDTAYVSQYQNQNMLVINAGTKAVSATISSLSGGPYGVSVGIVNPQVSVAPQLYTLSATNWIVYPLRYCAVTVSDASGLYSSGTTDDNGQVALVLYPTTQYTVNVNNSTQGVDYSMTIYPGAATEIPLRFFGTNPGGWFEDGGDARADVNTTVNATVNGANYIINATYNDASGDSTYVNISVWAKNASYNPQSGGMQWLYQNSSALSFGSGISSFGYEYTTTGAAGKDYRVTFNSTHSSYGNLTEDYDIHWPGASVTIPLLGANSYLYPWIALISAVLLAALFTTVTLTAGAVVLNGCLWLWWACGWFNTVTDSTTSALLLSFTTLVSMAAIIAMKWKEWGF